GRHPVLAADLDPARCAGLARHLRRVRPAAPAAVHADPLADDPGRRVTAGEGWRNRCRASRRGCRGRRGGPCEHACRPGLDGLGGSHAQGEARLRLAHHRLFVQRLQHGGAAGPPAVPVAGARPEPRAGGVDRDRDRPLPGRRPSLGRGDGWPDPSACAGHDGDRAGRRRRLRARALGRLDGRRHRLRDPLRHGQRPADDCPGPRDRRDLRFEGLRRMARPDEPLCIRGPRLRALRALGADRRRPWLRQRRLGAGRGDMRGTRGVSCGDPAQGDGGRPMKPAGAAPTTSIDASYYDTDKILRQAAATFFDRLSEMCEGILLVDSESRLVWINDRYERYLGTLGFTSPEQVIGRPIEEVVPNTMMRSVVETGRPILIDVIENPTGAFVVSRIPLHDDAGKVIGAIGMILYDQIDSLKPILGRLSRLQTELAAARQQLARQRRTRYTFSNFVGNSPAALNVKSRARRAAVLNTTVLLVGETGTGKELVAQAIHAASARASRPFIAINVAAIPETL